MNLLRWAKPHKGPPDHLTDFECNLRMTVFMILHAITLLPVILFVVWLAFAGPLAPMVVLNIPRMISEFHSWDSELRLCVGWYVTIVLICTPLTIWFRLRFLKPKSRKRKRYILVETE